MAALSGYDSSRTRNKSTAEGLLFMFSFVAAGFVDTLLNQSEYKKKCPVLLLMKKKFMFLIKNVWPLRGVTLFKSQELVSCAT